MFMPLGPIGQGTGPDDGGCSSTPARGTPAFDQSPAVWSGKHARLLPGRSRFESWRGSSTPFAHPGAPGSRPVAQRQSTRLTRGRPRGSTPAGTAVTEAEEVEAPDCGSGPSRCESGRSPHSPAEGGTPECAWPGGHPGLISPDRLVRHQDARPRRTPPRSGGGRHSRQSRGFDSRVGLAAAPLWGAWALSRATAPRAACSKAAGSPIARAVT